jgi:radical SAM protein with 4Fe4S-binding SPASM domain
MGEAMEDFEELTIELTDWCPSRCLHCSSNSSPTCNNHLETKLVLQLIDESIKLGAKKISFGGGEPTASKSFVPAVARAVTSGVSVEVFTCGLGIFGGQLQGLKSEIVNACKQLHGVKFIFSFHGASEGVHDYVTQTPNSFRLLITSLEKCLSAGIDCEMNFVPMRVNVHEFRDLVDLAERFRIRRLSILRFVPQGRGLENAEVLELNSEEENSFVEEVLRLRAEKNIDIRTGSPFNGIVPGNEVPCRAGTGKMVVQANGNVLPCEVFKHHERCKWNLSVYKQTLAEILSSLQIVALRNILGESNCLMCPVHGALRARLESGVRYERIPKAAVQT